MIAPSTIRSLSVADLNIPLHSPFVTAELAHTLAPNLLVTIELADGTRGYGEAAPALAFGESQAQVREALLSVRSLVEGADLREWRRIAAALRGAIGGAGAARCAIETAVLDGLTRQARMPLWAFFGGASTSLETDVTIDGAGAEQASVAALDMASRGIGTLKLRLSGDLARAISVIVAVNAVAPDRSLILDGGGRFSADQALELLGSLRLQGIRPVLFEQPVPADDWAGLEQIAAWGGVPVAIDESLTSLSDTLRLIFDRRAQVVNIKLMKSGIVEALDIVAVCRTAGLGLMIGSTIESPLAVGTAACFAAGLGDFRYVNLDAPLFMGASPFSGGYQQRGGLIDLTPIDAGHGMAPRE
jgi:L-Ala-D/L-Glu epimerase